MTDQLLIIFVKNPELGKVKTRLAADIGDEKALKAYLKLIDHTALITSSIVCDKIIYYSSFIDDNDQFQSAYLKTIQESGDLGHKMKTAFNENFNKGYKSIAIIGSDCAELMTKDIEEAFRQLKKNDIVIGPAKDGGYYLLGLNKPADIIFEDKPWSTDTVFKKTYLDALSLGYRINLLEEKTDIDTINEYEASTLFE